MEFGMDIGFIEHLQVVATNNIHTLQNRAVFSSPRSSLVVAWYRLLTIAIILLPGSIPPFQLNNTSESELLYDWRFTANHFVLAISPLRLTISNFF
jgi:hypothetical protein